MKQKSPPARAFPPSSAVILSTSMRMPRSERCSFNIPVKLDLQNGFGLRKGNVAL